MPTSPIEAIQEQALELERSNAALRAEVDALKAKLKSNADELNDSFDSLEQQQLLRDKQDEAAQEYEHEMAYLAQRIKSLEHKSARVSNEYRTLHSTHQELSIKSEQTTNTISTRDKEIACLLRQRNVMWDKSATTKEYISTIRRSVSNLKIDYEDTKTEFCGQRDHISAFLEHQKDHFAYLKMQHNAHKHLARSAKPESPPPFRAVRCVSPIACQETLPPEGFSVNFKSLRTALTCLVNIPAIIRESLSKQRLVSPSDIMDFEDVCSYWMRVVQESVNSLVSTEYENLKGTKVNYTKALKIYHSTLADLNALSKADLYKISKKLMGQRVHLYLNSLLSENNHAYVKLKYCDLSISMLIQLTQHYKKTTENMMRFFDFVKNRIQTYNQNKLVARLREVYKELNKGTSNYMTYMKNAKETSEDTTVRNGVLAPQSIPLDITPLILKLLNFSNFSNDIDAISPETELHSISAPTTHQYAGIQTNTTIAVNLSAQLVQLRLQFRELLDFSQWSISELNEVTKYPETKCNSRSEEPVHIAQHDPFTARLVRHHSKLVQDFKDQQYLQEEYQNKSFDVYVQDLFNLMTALIQHRNPEVFPSLRINHAENSAKAIQTYWRQHRSAR